MSGEEHRSDAASRAMKRRVSLLVTCGFLAASAIIGVQRYVFWRNRVLTKDEISNREFEEYLAWRAHAVTSEDKLLVGFEERVKTAALREKEVRRFTAADGVDRFEAWLVACAYFSKTFGSCGVVLAPEPAGERWRVRAGVGRNGNPVDVFVDARTGVITSDGQETVLDPVSLLSVR